MLAGVNPSEIEIAKSVRRKSASGSHPRPHLPRFSPTLLCSALTNAQMNMCLFVVCAHWCAGHCWKLHQFYFTRFFGEYTVFASSKRIRSDGSKSLCYIKWFAEFSEFHFTMVVLSKEQLAMAEKSGVWMPQMEKDACGVGFVTSIKGIATHKVSSYLMLVHFIGYLFEDDTINTLPYNRR